MTKDFLVAITKENFKVDNDTFELDDYTNLADISEILKEYEEEMLDYQVSNDERIEVASFNIYESANYWDLLLLINNIRDWRELPVNQDKLDKKLNEVYTEWLEVFGKFKSEPAKEEKYKELEEAIFLENEKYRNIRYIKKEKINELKAKIKDFVMEKRHNQYIEPTGAL